MAIFDKIGLDKISARVGEFLDEVLLPEGVAQSLAEAGRLMEREEFDAALRILYRVHAEQPSFSRVHHLIGLCLYRKGDFAQAYAAFERAVLAREEAVSHLYAGLAAQQLAEDSAQSGRLHQAQVHFRRGLQAAGSSELEFELHFGLGEVYLAQGRADKAVRELTKAMKRRPQQESARWMLVRALTARGKLKEAQALLDEAPQGVSPVQAALVRAELNEAQGDLAGALGAYEQALESMLNAADEDEADEVEKALVGAARAALGLGDGPRANQWLLRALGRAKAQRQGEIQALLGRANELIHNDARAVECYRAALDLSKAAGASKGAGKATRAPQWWARLGLGRILLASPQFGLPGESARAHFQTVLEHNGLDVALTREAQVGLARACISESDFSDARRLVDEVIRADQTPRADILAIWGQVALASGDAAEAALAFEEALGALDSGGQNTTPGTVQAQRQRVRAALEQALEAMRFSWNLPETAADSTSLREILHQTLDFVTSDARSTQFATHVQQLITEFDAPLSVAIVGEFNAGKSTLLNALIGEEIVPMGVLPTTAHTCFIRFGTRKAARVVQVDGKVLEVDLAEAKQQMKTNAAGIDHLEFLYPHPDLRSVEYWDTPGFNALEDAHEETAQRALQNAEAILWVLDANQALTQTEFAQIEQVSAGSERLLVLLNKIDRLGAPGARDQQVGELVDYIEENTAGRIAGCFALSGREALAHRTAADEPPAAHVYTTPGTVSEARSGLEEFQKFLDERIIQRSGRIKILEITRKLGGLVEEFDAFRQDLVARYEELGAAGNEIDSWLQGLHKEHPAARALAEARALEDHFDFLISSLAREIEEALATQDTLLARATLGRSVWAEEDRRFILELLQERIGDILERANQQVMSDVEALESQLAQRVGGIIAALPLADARAVSRRMEGFFGEARVLKMLFGERIFGRLQAQAGGQIAAAGEAVLDTIRPGADAATGARQALRQLLPQGRAQLTQELAQWYEEFFLAARRFLTRVQRDLHLLKLEAEHRFDASALRALIHSERHLS